MKHEYVLWADELDVRVYPHWDKRNAYVFPTMYDKQRKGDIKFKVTIEEVTDGWNDVSEKVKDGKVVNG